MLAEILSSGRETPGENFLLAHSELLFAVECESGNLRPFFANFYCLTAHIHHCYFHYFSPDTERGLIFHLGWHSQSGYYWEIGYLGNPGLRPEAVMFSMLETVYCVRKNLCRNPANPFEADAKIVYEEVWKAFRWMETKGRIIK